jgi:hypothetical protein
VAKLIFYCQRISSFEMKMRPCGVPDVLPGEFARINPQVFKQGLEWLMNIPVLKRVAIRFLIQGTLVLRQLVKFTSERNE